MGLFTHALAVVAPHIDMEEIENKAQSLLFEIAGDAIPTEKIVEQVADKMVVWIDEHISYGTGVVAKVVDSYDQVVLRWVMHLVVHRVYKELVDAKGFGPVES